MQHVEGSPFGTAGGGNVDPRALFFAAADSAGLSPERTQAAWPHSPQSPAFPIATAQQRGSPHPPPPQQLQHSSSSPALLQGSPVSRQEEDRFASPFRSPARAGAGQGSPCHSPWEGSPQMFQRSITAVASQCRSGSVPTAGTSSSFTTVPGSTSAIPSASFQNFARRSELWERQKALRAQELRRKREEEEEALCSFHPGAAAPSSARGSSSSSRTAAPRSRGAVKEVADRLSHPKPLVPRVSLDAVLWKEQRDEEAMRECTFQPDLSKSSRTFRSSFVKSAPSKRADDSMNKEGIDEDAEGAVEAEAPEWTGRRGTLLARHQAVAEATFAPLTNEVPASMVNAKAYLRDDVFTRLSLVGAAQAPVPQRGDRWMDESSIHSQASSVRRSHSSGSFVADASLMQFLERQNSHELRRRRHLSEVESRSAPTLQPEIGDRSRRLAERRRHQEATGTARSVRAEPKTTDELQERKCTFKPKLTKMGRDHDCRGVEQLASGDVERRKERLEKTQKDMEKQEVAGLFTPKVKNYNGVGSRLRVMKEPDSFLERMAQFKDAEMSRVRQKNTLREQREKGECTFTPKVLGAAPDFVRRMAESHRAARDARDKENRLREAQFDFAPEQRPMWR